MAEHFIGNEEVLGPIPSNGSNKKQAPETCAANIIVPIAFYKKRGETSFGAIQRFREENPSYMNETIAFAGRLDPMAEGEMLFLIGEETKRRDEFLGMDKEYETEIVLGIETDTFDVMGLIKRVKDPACKNISDGKDEGEPEGAKDAIEKIVAQKVGKQMQKFPPFSKRHVQGRALFVWASEGRLNEIEIPEHEVEIYSIEVVGFAEKSFGAIRDDAIARIQDVVGDFRQEKIIAGWQSNTTPEDALFNTLTLRVFCGTGTYIRQLAQDIGQELGCGATVLSIKRTKILQKVSDGSVCGA